MNFHFQGLNYYSDKPDQLFAFYRKLGLHVVEEKAADDEYYGGALSLSEDGGEPLLWIWRASEAERTRCCNNLYFKTNGRLHEVYEKIRAVGIECEPPAKAPWGGMEMLLTDPDGNMVLFL